MGIHSTTVSTDSIAKVAIATHLSPAASLVSSPRFAVSSCSCRASTQRSSAGATRRDAPGWAIDQNERNRLLIEEFHRNGGVVDDERFRDSILLLHTVGRRSEHAYCTPLTYLRDGDRFIVFASHQGAPRDPDWFLNLMTWGAAEIEVGTERLSVRATVLSGNERDELYRRQVAAHPRFGEYEQATTRTIPVIALVANRRD